ncbi:MAG: glycoside hydrolase/phage tail family protein [Rhodobacteraceae bacterium]|nr:glycoside hydrolase/phage tail family protein [Paracoccaceae bacterium]
MATIILAAAGGAIGSAIGGSVLGLGVAVIGRAIGGTIGNIIDQGLLGGSAPVEQGRVDALRLQGAAEGQPVPQVYGAMRVGGQLIWASRFLENVATGGSGKGFGPKTRDFSYSVSLAIALGEGEITRVGRIWADGKRLDMSGINIRVHTGSQTQMPDPAIVAVEGDAPAYRGVAYVVFEDLDITQFGNRVPQFNFEVIRARADSAADLVRAVALIPGSGEYALATEPVHYSEGKGENRAANTNNDAGLTDLEVSLEQMAGDLPNCESVSLVVSWFGDDLRCGSCSIAPKVEQAEVDGTPMPWQVSGAGRALVPLVSRDADNRPNFGGTPCDQSVLQSIAAIKAQGKAVMFYPFILMDIPSGNGLPDPYGSAEQVAFPWRGRITASLAPNQAGTPDKTAAINAEVVAFFGTAGVDDFAPAGVGVAYSGPNEWSYRRFVLHYAHLCALSGGVDSFCIGSELRGLTRLRAGPEIFPVVAALKALAADVAAILPSAKIGYAADWSEYFGYHPQDGSGDLLFHLDALWADDNIDFIGIDNYMPLSDWREGENHADAGHGSVYDLDYLKGNIAGGEGYDWYYANSDARALQVRTPITDGAYNEAWVYRYKDISSWWRKGHRNRIGGVQNSVYTDWLPQSKPIWFTEIGCPAIDKGTNQPNVFLDPKSAESQAPYFSNGGRDDFIQVQYLRALSGYWGDAANNPQSIEYDGPMVEMGRAHVWAWDARPWPDFPMRGSVWSDGANYGRGHWISGRLTAAPLDGVVRDICARSGVSAVDTDQLYGVVSGALMARNETARQSVQPLMLAYGFESFEVGGKIVFRTLDGRVKAALGADDYAIEGNDDAPLSLTRAPESETAGRVRISYVEPMNDFQRGAAEAAFPDKGTVRIGSADLPLALSSGQAQAVAARWLAEARIARDGVEFVLPPSRLGLSAGDVVALDDSGIETRYRIDRVEDFGLRKVSATRVEPGVYRPALAEDRLYNRGVPISAGPVYAEFMDLPLLRGSEIPHAPTVAVTATPWPGEAAVFSASSDAGYLLEGLVVRKATMGVLRDDLLRAIPAIWSEAEVRVRVSGGALQSRGALEVLGGANLAALRTGGGDWEVFQFRDAELLAPGEYRLKGLLRGQAGTDGVMPDIWPAGSDFVLLDGAQVQLDVPASRRGLPRHYRIGPASLGYDSPRYVHSIKTFEGVGLRPYMPAHLKVSGSGDLVLGWVRRTRIDGDSWAGPEVPLGEESEAYRLRVVKNGAVLREETLVVAGWTYSAANQESDGAAAPFDIEVAQISTTYGAGPDARITING